MSTRVFIDGEAGTTGLRLRERLLARPDIELLRIDEALRKDETERARLANSADIVFLCLPDDAARAAVAGVTNPHTKVIDASTAHRTAPGWAYGLPELSAEHRAAVRAASRISVPGCYAMGFVSLVTPLVRGGIAAPDYPFTVHALSGYSGAGKGAIARYADAGRPQEYGAPRQYALGQSHKHHPEMQAVPGLTYAPVFHPTIADYYAGMVVSVPLHTRLLQSHRSAQELHAYFSDYYANQPLFHVRPFGAEADLPEKMLDPLALAGRDDAELYICGGSERVLLAARFDNLGKGASGAALQNMNLALGLDETTGLVVGD